MALDSRLRGNDGLYSLMYVANQDFLLIKQVCKRVTACAIRAGCSSLASVGTQRRGTGTGTAIFKRATPAKNAKSRRHHRC